MYDLIVVGGGIVGLATAQRYLSSKPGRRVLLLEKESRVCAHQSGRNSGVLHSGVYYAPGSRKALNCRRGKQLMERFCRENGVPFETCGKLIVATREVELEPLAELERRGLANGVQLERVDARGIERHEPEVRGLAGLHVAETGVVDFARVGAALAERIEADGGELRLGARVERLVSRDDGVEAVLGTAVERGRRAIVCAGLQADRLARRAGLAGDLRVVPFRGEYFALRAAQAHRVRALVYPVPDPAFPFLGVHLTRRIDGTVDAGPNALLALSRESRARFALTPRDALETLGWPGLWRLVARHLRMGLGEFRRSLSSAAFASEARRLLPALRAEWLERAPAGVRAQVLDRAGRLVEDFAFARDGGVLHLLNAPSPAATSALAIADELLAKHGTTGEACIVPPR